MPKRSIGVTVIWLSSVPLPPNRLVPLSLRDGHPISVRATFGERGTISESDCPSHLVARPLFRQGNQGAGKLGASIVPRTLSLLFSLYEYLRRKIVAAQCAGNTFGERGRSGHRFSPLGL